MPAALIINADDLGRSGSVNTEVFRLLDKGKITSATIIATGSAFEEGVRRAKGYPQCSFGVHLFLDEFHPVTDLTAFPSVLSEDGRFQPEAREYAYNRALRKALTQEWVAQVRRVQGAGIPVSHLDSHHHIHTFPWVFPVLKRVQRLTGVRKIRCTLNRYLEPKRGLLLAKWLYNTALRHFPTTTTTNYFMPFGLFCALLQGRRVGDNATYELMVHPGASTYMEAPQEYEAELAMLEGDWERVLPPGFRLISYNELN